MDMLCVAAESDPYGYVLVNGQEPTLIDLCRITGEVENVVAPALAELERNGVFSRDRSGRIFCRRMVRESKIKKISEKNGKLGGNPALLANGATYSDETIKSQGVNPDDNPTDNREDNRDDNGGVGPSGLRPESSKEKEKESSKKKKIDEQFHELWVLFPRRVAKGQALIAYRAARKKTDATTIAEAVKRFAAECADREERFIAHPASWLNGERWLDGISTSEARPALTAEQQAEIVWRRRIESFLQNGSWSGHYGFPPDDPHCYAPEHLLIEYGFREKPE